MHTKNNKLRVFLEKSFSKTKSSTPRLQIWKENFSLGKNYRNLFCIRVLLRSEKCRVFFAQPLKKNMKRSKKNRKNRNNRKKQDRSLPQFECTFEKTVEKFSAEVRMFKLTVQKILNFWHKSTKTSSLQEKWNTEYFFAEVFLKVWRFSAQSRAMKKHYLCKKIPNCSSVHVFSCFEKITATFCPIFDKKAQVPRKKND